MRGYGVLLIKEITEQWRTGRLPVVAAIFLLFGLASPVLAKYTPDIVKLAASSIDLHVPTPTIKDAVARLLVKPVSRFAFLAAKFSGLAMTMAAAVLLCGLAAYLYTELLFAPLSVLGFGGACLAILLGLLEIAAVTFLGSTLVRSSIPAAGIGIVALVVAGVVSSLPNVGRFTPFGLNELASDLALQQTATGGDWPVIANVGFVVVGLAASWLVFRRQEV